MKYSTSQCAKTLYDLLEEDPRKKDEIVRSFAKKLVSSGAARDLRSIASAFSREWYIRNHIVPTEVTVAEQGVVKKHELEKTLGKKIEFVEKTDPSVVAGVRIKIGDYQVDNTLARRLSDLRNTITK